MEASSVTLNDTTVPSPGVAAGSRDGSPVRHRVVLALTLVAGLALLAWTLWALRRDGALGTGAVYLGFTSVVFLGTGHLVLRLAGVDGDGVTWLGLRYVVGFAVSAFVVTLVGMSGHTGLALWPALALGVAGWGVGVWDLAGRRRPRPAGSLLAGELLIGAALLRVAVEGTGYWRVTGSRASSPSTSTCCTTWPSSRSASTAGCRCRAGSSRAAYRGSATTRRSTP